MKKQLALMVKTTTCEVRMTMMLRVVMRLRVLYPPRLLIVFAMNPKFCLYLMMLLEILLNLIQPFSFLGRLFLRFWILILDHLKESNLMRRRG